MVFTKTNWIFFFVLTFYIQFLLLLMLHRPQKAVETFKALPWYEQSCIVLDLIERGNGNWCILKLHADVANMKICFDEK